MPPGDLGSLLETARIYIKLGLKLGRVSGGNHTVDQDIRPDALRQIGGSQRPCFRRITAHQPGLLRPPHFGADIR